MTMILLRPAAVVLSLLAAPSALAQDRHHFPPAPYAGFESRSIKSLSDEQVADLKAGRGMGLALAAELNGYPGPLHVLELADRLGLTAGQRSRVQELLDGMRAETVPLGERLIEQEAELDRMFASKTATPEGIAAATQAIGATQGALRAAHLKYHLTTAALLTPDQVAQYGRLRGYGGGHRPGHGGHRG